MVSRAKPGKIASSPILLANNTLRGMNKIDAEGIDFVYAAAGEFKNAKHF